MSRSTSYTLPQIRGHIDRTAVGKLNRTEKGRELLAADETIIDAVKYDPERPDRIWLGTTVTALQKDKHRTMVAVIDDETYNTLKAAINVAGESGDLTTLAAFGMRLYAGFASGHNTCPFIQEPKE